MNIMVINRSITHRKRIGMKKIAVINDLSGFGKCSLGVALPIISTMGVQCCPLPTSVLSNQTGYDSYKCVDLTNDMNSFANEWQKLNAHFDGIITGFISNSAQGEIISSFINNFKSESTIVIVDPVLGDNGVLYPSFDEKSIMAIKKLCQKADIITPNLTELCIIANENYNDICKLSYENLKEKLEIICNRLNKTVIITGITLNDSTIATGVYCNNSLTMIESEKIGGSFSGTGDILASIIGACAIKEIDIIEATQTACDFITKSIKQTIKETGGKYNPCDGVHFETYLHTLGTNNEH